MTAAAIPYLQRGPERPAGEDGRRGKVTSLRLTENDRATLAALAHAAISEMPYSYERRTGSLTGFIVWAALQWRPKTKEARAALSPELLGSTKTELPGGKRRATSRRVLPRRRRRGTTRKRPAAKTKKGGRK